MRRYLPEYTKKVLSSGRCTVSVWGAISKDGLGPFVRIDGRFNACGYCGIIDDVLLPYVYDRPFKDGCFLLQPDRSPIHKARCVIQRLDHRQVPQLEWPPNGADLNPVGNTCSLMKFHLARSNIANATADALWVDVKEEWERLQGCTDVVAALYESMPRRIHDVIAADGNYTGD
ncbi:hypothetical protein HPB48_021516 [Haemaphysalis longicornis]|uniref:Uncharacterized protein n=1 Tax=Haemaphysalis longicornis TaxID=44386 RepID=A0A9J6GDU4_HAELO|nr:hypothetical protein HPB48_021516 [Haemaphysalis longicornis]